MTTDKDETKVEAVPPHETTAAPVNISVAEPHYFGVTPPVLLFGTATATLAVAVALAILTHWLAALILAVEQEQSAPRATLWPILPTT